MANSPKIKMYQVPPGFTQDSNNDVQQATLDELLPVVPRSQLLSDVMPLTGIVPIYQGALQPIDIGSGRSTYPMVPPSGSIQTPYGIPWVDVIKAYGYYGIVITDQSTNPIPDSNWAIVSSGISFPSVPPSGAQLSCFRTASIPCQDWALQSDSLYSGPNPAFNTLLVNLDDGPLQMATPQAPHGGYIHTSTGASGVKANYAYNQSLSKFFCGDNCNWVTNHMWLKPDVFVGTKDYPGDQSVVNGVPYQPGPLPNYQDPSTYSLDARNGLVTFITPVDSNATAVTANYSYLNGIGNVTGQRLQQVVGQSGRAWKAIDETAYPDSHGKRIIMQKSDNLPLNVYVNGESVPRIQSVVPYDQLTVITGP